MNRYRIDDEQRSTRNDCCRKSTSGVISSDGCEVLRIVSHPKEACKLFREYQMVSNVNIFSQLLYILVLVHLFIKSAIYIAVRSDKEKMKYLDGIVFYPDIAGASKISLVFNYLFLGFTLLAILNRVTRICGVISRSLKNADEYRELRVTQLNFSFLASFYLSFSEWISFWNYINNHDAHYHSNRTTQIKHLELNEQVQKKLPRLSRRDATFYFNPIDFSKCFENSNLPNDEERMKRYFNWHFATPIDKISCASMREVIGVTVGGTFAVSIGLALAAIGLLNLELRSEFSENYSPTIQELLDVAPKHLLNLKHLIRFLEGSILFVPQLSSIYDLSCVFMDLQAVTSRAHRMVQKFELHLETIRQYKAKFDNQEKQTQLLIHFNQNHSSESNFSSDRLKFEYNWQIKGDIALIGLLYHEFLNTRKHHTQFLNLVVLSGGICVAYITNILMSQAILVGEVIIMVAFLVSVVVPIIGILLYCAKMERTVS